MQKSDFFLFPIDQVLLENNQTGFLLVRGDKIALFWVKNGIFGPKIADFEVVYKIKIYKIKLKFLKFNLLTNIMMTGMLGAHLGTITGDMK